MAAVAAEELIAEEGGESSFLKQDSKENAQSGGVDADSIVKFIGTALNLALAMNDLVRDIRNNKIDDSEQKRYRFSVGIIYPMKIEKH